jgi:4'-phosphopantetheinyl transferase EntD
LGARRLGAGRPSLALRARTLGALKPSAQLSLARSNHAMQGLLAWLRDWLPPGFGVAASAITDRPISEYAAEEKLIVKSASQRRNAFRAGRCVARQALAQLGCAPAAILAHPQKDPIWPPGFVGSITHSERIALAIAATEDLIQAVGVDLEQEVRLEPRLVPTVCRPDESSQEPMFAALGIDHAKLTFVAKEAVYKAIFPRQRAVLAFHCLRLRFQIAQGSFQVSLAAAPDQRFTRIRGTGRFLSRPDLLAAAFVKPQPALRRRA